MIEAVEVKHEKLMEAAERKYEKLLEAAEAKHDKLQAKHDDLERKLEEGVRRYVQLQEAARVERASAAAAAEEARVKAASDLAAASVSTPLPLPGFEIVDFGIRAYSDECVANRATEDGP